MSNTSRFASRDRGMSSRDGLSGFRSPTRATREMPGGDWEQAEEFDGSRVGRGGESLSCFVEVKFRGKAQRTAAVDSNMPMWNEQVRHSSGSNIGHCAFLPGVLCFRMPSMLTVIIWCRTAQLTAAPV